jgi:hypothetical protein
MNHKISKAPPPLPMGGSGNYIRPSNEPDKRFLDQIGPYARQYLRRLIDCVRICEQFLFDVKKPKPLRPKDLRSTKNKELSRRWGILHEAVDAELAQCRKAGLSNHVLFLKQVLKIEQLLRDWDTQLSLWGKGLLHDSGPALQSARDIQRFTKEYIDREEAAKGTPTMKGLVRGQRLREGVVIERNTGSPSRKTIKVRSSPAANLKRRNNSPAISPKLKSRRFANNASPACEI